MSVAFSYKDYAGDERFMTDYIAYQGRYATRMRDSDRVLIDIVRELMGKGRAAAPPLRVLDIGCSTGNLLLHLHRAFPTLELTGGDLARSAIDACRSNSALAGIEFHVMDMLALPTGLQFDIIIANAAMMFLDAREFGEAIASMGRAVKRPGVLIAFDLFHEFEQPVAISEVSASHPEGICFQFRPYSVVADALRQGGFAHWEFRAFEMSVDLPRSADPANISTHTVRAADGRRLNFRGCLYLPWCHLVAWQDARA